MCSMCADVWAPCRPCCCPLLTAHHFFNQDFDWKVPCSTKVQAGGITKHNPKDVAFFWISLFNVRLNSYAG